MEEKILRKIEELSEEMLETVCRMVQIDSVKGAPAPHAPYGTGVKAALDAALALAERMGLRAVNIDDRIGYAGYGTGAQYVCAIGHLDVVPVGVGWKYPPFGGVREDGMIYGRGVLDNKGPIFACLYALYALKELGISLGHEVRVIFGCDEESGFSDLRYYLEREAPPVMGFTPDCKYPVVYAERGRARFRLQPDSTEGVCRLLNEYVLNARGGERFPLHFSDEEFGTLEIHNFKLINGEPPALECAASYPAGCTAEEMRQTLQKEIPWLTVTLLDDMKPVRFPKNCTLVDTLRQVYERVTGMDGTPVTTTGGTYAKLMPHIVPFGPSFPGQKGIGHQPNEWIRVDDLILNAKIYALSLYHLAKDGRQNEIVG